MLDNIEVKIGDMVYDIMLGYCRVTGVARDGSFQIKAQDAELIISKGGFLGRSRRVYWDNPIVIIPKKNDKSFKMAKNIMQDVYVELNKNTWGFNEDSETVKED